MGRFGSIDGSGLDNTTATQRTHTTRLNDVSQSSTGVFVTANHHLNHWFRIQPVMRADAFFLDVDSNHPANSGAETDAIVSPKLNLIFGPWADTEFHANAGTGFHSNEARGTTISVDPVTGLSADKVDPLVQTDGFELGARTDTLENVVSTLALFCVPASILLAGSSPSPFQLLLWFDADYPID